MAIKLSELQPILLNGFHALEPRHKRIGSFIFRHRTGIVQGQFQLYRIDPGRAGIKNGVRVLKKCTEKCVILLQLVFDYRALQPDTGFPRQTPIPVYRLCSNSNWDAAVFYCSGELLLRLDSIVWNVLRSGNALFGVNGKIYRFRMHFLVILVPFCLPRTMR